jgi:transposase
LEVDLSQKQLQRIVVIENAVAGRVSVAEAAEALGRSERQVKRLKRQFDRSDSSWVLHGSQGRAPVNRTPEELRRRIIELARGKYAGFNDTHLREKLGREEAAIAVSRSTVRRILRAAGLRSPQKRRPAKYRSRRVRRAQEGMLLLIDGSCHAWLERRGPELTLLGLIDDATCKVPAAHFQLEHENSAGYLRLLRGLVEGPGIPVALYRDQHSTLQRNDEHWSLEEQLAGQQLPTQVGRALQELGVEIIVARSPQAKGRIERLWRTFQDRLVSELRLAQAATLEHANAVLVRFLEDYNRQFARAPRQAGSAYRKLDRRLDLDRIFSLRYERKVSNDHVIRVGPGLKVQLPPLPGNKGFAGATVQVCHAPDGRIRVYLDDRLLLEQAADPWAGPVRALDMQRGRAPRKKKPLRVYTFAGRPAIRS